MTTYHDEFVRMKRDLQVCDEIIDRCQLHQRLDHLKEGLGEKMKRKVSYKWHVFTLDVLIWVSRLINFKKS